MAELVPTAVAEARMAAPVLTSARDPLACLCPCLPVAGTVALHTAAAASRFLERQGTQDREVTPRRAGTPVVRIPRRLSSRAGDTGSRR